eukprot:TRINITY_DN1173_c4_g1_i1.p1 TRINITY_DN1173_c4_g1~~TRINITY_DN1173_c4_g1_i1.p1  ORF type:complete len:182 (+),score=29.20 TRINITY_DN1173_c4_g1_i1:21-566(+)
MYYIFRLNHIVSKHSKSLLPHLIDSSHRSLSTVLKLSRSIFSHVKGTPMTSAYVKTESSLKSASSSSFSSQPSDMNTSSSSSSFSSSSSSSNSFNQALHIHFQRVLPSHLTRDENSTLSDYQFADFSTITDHDVITIRPTTTLFRILQLFKRLGLRYVLICSPGGQLQGIIKKKSLCSLIW